MEAVEDGGERWASRIGSIVVTAWLGVGTLADWCLYLVLGAGRWRR